MKKIFLAGALSLWAFTLSAGEIARGYVYEDANANGKRERNEKGVASVGVSNGSGIVYTDARGYYEFPVESGNTIFVIKPAGYAFPQDECLMPRFYYVHKPEGSPGYYKFKGVSPTGPLPRSLDFALKPSPEPDEFTALIFGDPQVRNRAMLGFFERKIVSELVDSPDIAFGVSLGDVSDEDLDLMGDIKAVTARIGAPWYYVNGNHDTNYDAPEDRLASETFIRYFGPTDYAFNYAGSHVLVIDNIYFPNPEKPDERRWVSRSGLREDQRRFIENDLAGVSPDKLVILMMHVPLCDDWNRENDVAAYLMGQLSRFEHVLVLASHWHVQLHNYYGAEEGWNGRKPLHEYVVGTTCGSWYSGFPDENGIPESMMRDGTPQGYAYLHVKGNTYSLDYKVAGMPADYRMSILHPKVVIRDLHTPSFITVNFFMGHRNDTVEYRIDGGPWQAMTHTVMNDPYYQNMCYRWDMTEAVHTTRWPGEAVPSQHIWRAPMPSKGYAAGRHSIEVRATDLTGRVFYGASDYRVADPPNNDCP